MKEISNRLNVLVVMRESFDREEIVRMLTPAAGSILLAGDGEQGLQVFRAKNPDLVITDNILDRLDMPSMLEAMRRRHADLPVIVFYDKYNPGSLLRAVEHNVDAFVRLPVTASRLEQAYRRCEETIRMRRKLARADHALWEVLDVFPGPVLLAGREGIVYVNRRMARYFGYRDHLEMVADGVEVTEFVQRFNGKLYDPEVEDWMEIVEHDPLDRDHVIHLENIGGGRPAVFSVTHNPFPVSGMRLFVLQDVSDFEDEASALRDEAGTDPLTGAMNRRSFLARMGMETLGAGPVSLVMFDIDHFKSINDTYGHDVGDDVLKEISVLVRHNIREGDVLGRWGGEEFMVLSSGSSLEQALQMAERLRSAVEGFAFTGVPRPITSSFGVALHRDGEFIDDLIKRVDTALYEAKHGGRNRVVSAD